MNGVTDNVSNMRCFSFVDVESKKRDVLNEAVSVGPAVMLVHVIIEHVVLSFFSLAERRRNFDIEFCMVFMSSFNELLRRFFFSFLLVE
jgi:hypothetical protein